LVSFYTFEGIAIYISECFFFRFPMV